MSSIEINFKYNNIGRMKVKGLKKVCKQQPKESRHGCINIRKSRLQNKENYQRTLYNYKRAIHQKDTATLNTYAPNRGAKPKNQNLKGKRQIHKQTWRLQHPVSTTDRIPDRKPQQGYGRTQPRHQPTGSKWYLQNIPPNHHRMHILFKCSWNTSRATKQISTN